MADPEDDEVEGEDQTEPSDDEGAEVGEGSEGGADETDELDEDEGQEEVDLQPEKPPSRGEKRFQQLSNTAREATERAAAAERQLQEVTTRLARLEQPQQQTKEPTQDEMALWTTDQIVDYRMNKGLGPVLNTVRQIQFEAAEMADKTSFEALCARDPRAARMAPVVEQALKEMRANGQTVPRATLYKFKVGEMVVDKGTKAATAQRQQGARRIERQQTRPSNARSDRQANTGRGSAADEREKRLRAAGFFADK